MGDLICKVTSVKYNIELSKEEVSYLTASLQNYLLQSPEHTEDKKMRQELFMLFKKYNES